MLVVVGRVANVYQIGNFRNLISFLVFGSNPQGRNAHQLQFVPVNHIGAEVRVDDVDRDEKGLRVQVVFEMHINQPVEQNHSHVLCDVGLVLEVVEVLKWFAYRSQQILQYLLLVHFFLSLGRF